MKRFTRLERDLLASLEEAGEDDISEALFALVTAPATTVIETKIIVFAVTYVLGFAALHIVVLSLLSGKIKALERRLSDLEKPQPS
jgi:hypothetical protein